MCLPSAIWPNFWDPLTLKIFLPYGYVIKKVRNILLYEADQFYVKKQDGSWKKICEIFSGKSFKEDLSIDTTFDPCYFSWESTFKWRLFCNDKLVNSSFDFSLATCLSIGNSHRCRNDVQSCMVLRHLWHPSFRGPAWYCHISGIHALGVGLALPALVLAQQLVTVGAVVLCNIQGPAAEGNQAEWPAPAQMYTVPLKGLSHVN